MSVLWFFGWCRAEHDVCLLRREGWHRQGCDAVAGGAEPVEEDPEVALVELADVVAAVDDGVCLGGGGEGGEGDLQEDQVGAGDVVAQQAGLA